VVALAVGAPARADVVRLSRQQTLRALAQPAASPRQRGAARVTGAPTVITGAASDITSTSANVNGTVNPNGRRTTYHFEYGTTTAYGSRAPASDAVAGSSRTDQPVSTTLTGLLAGTTYHFRLVATNSKGTSYGADATFITSSGTPPPSSGTYTNPVYGSFPDPMALLTGTDYYAYGTGSNFPILHSTDLVNWSSAGTAFTSSTFPSWDSGNPWAPSVLAVPTSSSRSCPGFNLPDGATCFFMYYTGLNNNLATPSNCIGVATSDRPDGGFKDQGILSNGTTTSRGPLGCGDAAGYSNIDPAPLIDSDGRAYLYYETGHDASGGSASTISVVPLDTDLVHASAGRTPLVTGTQDWELRGSDKIVEGPWVQHRGSYYYLFYSGGDWQADYAMGYAVGSSPTGPFTKSARNPILKGTSSVIGPGGGSVTRGPVTGADQMIYHARADYGLPRTLRIDRLVWDDTGTPATVIVNGPTTTPQPLP
jgi:beta-xylosidase